MSTSLPPWVNGAFECESNEVLDFTTQSVAPTPQTCSSTQNCLTKHYKAILESNSWLAIDDEIVKAKQALY